MGGGCSGPEVWAGLVSTAETPADLIGSSLIPAVLQRNGLFRSTCFPFVLLNHKTNVEMSKVLSPVVFLALCFRHLLKL